MTEIIDHTARAQAALMGERLSGHEKLCIEAGKQNCRDHKEQKESIEAVFASLGSLRKYGFLFMLAMLAGIFSLLASFYGKV